MSAIAGLVRFSGQELETDELTASALRLNSPGIKAAAFWTEGIAGLLVRQRVVTFEDMAERQPWVGCGGRLVLVYDGRLDNRGEVAASLGISLKDDIVPDGRLFLAALERWGEAALPRFIGDFALALWDKDKRKLMLACDQMGERTLYYHQGADFIAFASTCQALLALPGVPRKIDELYIADFLILNTRFSDSTSYEGVRRLPNATAALFDKLGLRLNRYWTPEPKSRLHLSSDDEYLEAAREQLDRAVACRLRAKDPVASMMTGGLDSSAVAATAAMLLAPDRLLTVTSVPPEEMMPPQPHPAFYNDERPYIDAIAAMHANMNPAILSSAAAHWIETDPSPFFEAGGLPTATVSNVGWFAPLYEQLQKDGISVLLTGEGGNFSWSWDGLRRLPELLLRGNWLRLMHELKLTGRRRPYDMDWKTLLRSQVLSPLSPPALARWRRRLRKDEAALWTRYSAINPDFARKTNLFERKFQAGAIPFCRPLDSMKFRLEPLNAMAHRRDMTAIQRELYGIECRSPLQDIRLIEFCLSIPDEQYLKDGMTRRLTRLALADRLPGCVLENFKIGIQNPENLNRLSAIRAGLIDEIEALKKVPLAAHCIDLPRLAEIARSWQDDDGQSARVLQRAIHVGRFLRWAENGL